MSTLKANHTLQLVEEYRPLLESFDLANLEMTENPVYAIDSKFRIILVNPAYFNFALENNGTRIYGRFGLGSSLLDAISGELHDFYDEFFHKIISRGEQVSKEYECSSPDLYRVFRMDTYPLQDGRGVLTEHCLIIEKRHDRPESELPIEAYIDTQGLLHQCSHCRRIRHFTDERWDWSKLALSWKEVSHSICPRCYGFYYPEFAGD